MSTKIKCPFCPSRIKDISGHMRRKHPQKLKQLKGAGGKRLPNKIRKFVLQHPKIARKILNEQSGGGIIDLILAFRAFLRATDPSGVAALRALLASVN